jgi:hypothetical protein
VDPRDGLDAVEKRKIFSPCRHQSPAVQRVATRVAEKTFENKAEGRRKVGRARLRWLEDADNDSRRRLDMQAYGQITKQTRK